MTKSQNNENVAVPASGSSNNTISIGYADIENLAAKCWCIFPSFRLFAELLRTKRYDTVYVCLMRGKAFPACKRSRPSRDEQVLIASISPDIISAMSNRSITVRRWCQAHGFGLADLCNPDGIENDVAYRLKEDFPEIFRLPPPEYKTAPIGCDRKQRFDSKKKRHIFWSIFFGIRVEHYRESKALRLYNWRINLVVIKRRLQLLLEKGTDAALSYPSTEFLPLSDVDNKRTGKRIPVNPEQKALEQKLQEIMQRDSETNALIRKLIPKGYYLSDEEYEQQCSIREQLVKTYDWTVEQIHHEVERRRREKAGHN